MRKPLIAANWKMNKTIDETVEFINAFIPIVQDVTDVEVVIAPPLPSLSAAAGLLKGTAIGVAAQNIFYEEKGAFTGETSASMLRSAGCRWVIIGHSERRQIFLETDEIINRKVKTAIQNGLEVILCIGETIEEREKNLTFEVLDRQLAGSLNSVELSGITIAYEPVWAIGTGRTATPAQADETHTHIRQWLRKYGKGADDVRILYGGSVKPDNIASLMEKPDVDGALVGGASLHPDSFAGIVKGAWKK
jgi:triosephosphate isomerase